MPLKATFAADFSSFTQAVDQAVVTLKGFESTASRVDKGISRFGDQFSGRKIMQDAALMARAIEDIGGVAKLTEKELLDVGAKAEAAIAKMKVMGVEVPKNLQHIADAAAGVGKSTTLASKGADLLKSSFGQMVGAFGVANLISNAASALVSFGKAALDDAGHLVDLADKTGISIDALQEMQFAAEQSGAELDNMTDAAFKLGVNIAGGKKSVKGAVDELGLSFADLQRMTPEAQFEKIVGALGRLEDVQERNRLGVELFGKSFSNIAAAVASDYEKLAAAAPKMGEAQVRAANDAAEAWERTKTRIGKGIGDTLGNIALFVEALAKEDEKLRGMSVGEFFPGEQRPAAPTPARPASVTPPAAVRAATDYVAALQKAQAEVTELTAAERKSIDAGLAYGESQDDLAESVGISTQALRLYTQQQQQLAHAAKQAATERTQQAKERRQQTAQQQKEIAAYVAKDVDDLQRLAAATNDVAVAMGGFTEAQQKALEVTPPKGEMPWDVRTWKGAQDASDAFFASVIAQSEAIPDIAGRMIPPTAKAAGLFAGFGKQLGADLGGSILAALQGGGNVVQSIAGTVGASFTRHLFGEKSGVMKSITDKLPKMLGGMTSAILPGIGALAGPAIEGISKLFGKVFKSESKQVNDLRDDWITSTYGTSDNLRKMAAEAGVSDAALRRLFSVSKVKDFEAAATAVNAALGSFADEQAADVARLDAAITKYGFSLEQLGPALQKQKLDEQAKELIEDWRVLVDAGVEIATVNENMAATVNEFLQSALKTGQEIPIAFKPILDRMVQQGTLTDAAGNKIEDLQSTGITYAETMTQGFDRIVTKLDELIQKIAGTSDELTALPDIERTLTYTVQYRTEGEPPGGNGSETHVVQPESYLHEQSLPGFQHGTGGRYLDFGQGTPVMLHGRERVSTEDEPALASAQVDAMVAAVAGLQVSIVRALRENALQVRDQTQLALARA